MSEHIQLPAAPPGQQQILDAGGVAVWREPVEIGTYEPDDPTPFPMFLDRRVYQGSSGKVYPLPFIERIGRERRPRRWDAIHIENRWVRLMLLPELGGRIHIGYDKIADYDFFYRNNVIKPALVGLAGPWISGGVEFNWPQHHRPGTFLPVEARIEREDDGSVVVWHSDHEPFGRMRSLHGVTLRPDTSLIELQVRLHNRTEVPQTFLWWANVAARSSDDFQSFFPTDVQYVADHARRAVTAFPRADRPYYGVDYPARAAGNDREADRLDLSRNIPVPTSYMVLETRDDFFGGYDHAAKAGFVHWADRRIAPGKKQWTWGNAPFGHAWDRLLTDDDGPYVELMAGVFTDNQPDFSYLGPDEVRTFSQYWYPISQIGIAQQATKEAALSIEITRPGVARIGVVATRGHELADIVLSVEGIERRVSCVLTPSTPMVREVAVPLHVDVADLVVSVIADGTELVTWRAHVSSTNEPAVATEPPSPRTIASSDELYLTGVHLQQYRHPTRSPEPYFDEVLDRDPGDVRANLAVAARLYAIARFDDAKRHVRRAQARLTARNPNPADGEAWYRLGLIHMRQEHWSDARDAFAKASWDVKWSAPAHLEAAFAEARANNPQAALDELGVVPQPGRGRLLRVTMLLRLGRADDADAELAAVRLADGLDPWAVALDGGTPADPGVACDVAMDADAAGDTGLALRLLRSVASAGPGPAGNHGPIAHYLAAAILQRVGRAGEAEGSRRRAREADDALCFPAGLDAESALRHALDADTDDLRARSLLGTWLYGVGRRAEALEQWRLVIDAGGADAVVLRNAAVASVNVFGGDEFAERCYERAIEADPRQSRLWLERDTLAERRGASPESRLSALTNRPDDALIRDDLTVVTAELLCSTGDPEAAHRLLAGVELQPWEGGEGRSIAAWEQATLGLARKAMARSDPAEAQAWIASALDTPVSLGEARHLLASVAEILVLRGDAMHAAGEHAAARASWEAALQDPASPRPGVDTHTKSFWVGVAADRLGDGERAEQIWDALDAAAVQVEQEAGAPDYFATSLPSTLLFDVSPVVVRREAALLRDLARQGRTLSAVRKG